MEQHKYSHHFTDLLLGLGYTHCFFVPGGNIMHLLDSARTRMTCVPFVHEVSAAIAAEYFNEISSDRRAYVLVTAGPGITNALTGLTGAYLESRDLLVVGGQVKSVDLAGGVLRQRGIQEIDGLSIAAPVCSATARITEPVPDRELVDVISAGLTNRRGPVFIEFCLDAQNASVNEEVPQTVGYSAGPSPLMVQNAAEAAEVIAKELVKACRPVILIGGGVSHEVAFSVSESLGILGVPLMTTWNGFDRVPDMHSAFAGRPNTWGQRSANILLSQSDLVVALGTRLGIQQTGFNWRDWGYGRVVQVDVDPNELAKGHPRVDVALRADANEVIRLLSQINVPVDPEWVEHCKLVRERVPILDPANSNAPDFMSPFELVNQLSDSMIEGELMIPASSGSGQFVPMEVFRCKTQQRVVTNKGLASMGYGLAAAIGASFARPNVRTVLVEGDGSFSQNFQELGTLALHGLCVKIFLLDNDGYASIRTTQRNYFGGAYMGCDSSTGLGFPDWGKLAEAFGIPWVEIGPAGLADSAVNELFAAKGPAFFVVKVDPEQTYFPKVSSRISEDGSMESNPIHHMTPELSEEIAAEVFRFGHHVAKR